jgi:Domain of unknown function (DUF4258)
MNFVFSKHALEQMELRSISKSIVEEILASPDQIKAEEGKMVYQSVVEKGRYLIRIFVNDESPKTVITVYKTSKISKYYESKI